MAHSADFTKDRSKWGSKVPSGFVIALIGQVRLSATWAPKGVFQGTHIYYSRMYSKTKRLFWKEGIIRRQSIPDAQGSPFAPSQSTTVIQTGLRLGKTVVLCWGHSWVLQRLNLGQLPAHTNRHWNSTKTTTIWGHRLRNSLTQETQGVI